LSLQFEESDESVREACSVVVKVVHESERDEREHEPELFHHLSEPGFREKRDVVTYDVADAYISMMGEQCDRYEVYYSVAGEYKAASDRGKHAY